MLNFSVISIQVTSPPVIPVVAPNAARGVTYTLLLNFNEIYPVTPVPVNAYLLTGLPYTAVSAPDSSIIDNIAPAVNILELLILLR